MGVMKTMHQLHGDEQLAWDPNDLKQVTRARTRFEELLAGTSPTARGRTHRAFLMEDGGTKKGKQIDAFDPSAGTILMVPAIAGGAEPVDALTFGKAKVTMTAIGLNRRPILAGSRVSFTLGGARLIGRITRVVDPTTIEVEVEGAAD